VPVVSSRALVVGVVDPALDGEALMRQARQMVGTGADLLEVTGSANAARVGAAVDVAVVAPGEIDAEPADDAATVAVAILAGAPAVRTHEVRVARRVADVLALLMEASPP
jgi:dihydropteroate synthase